MKLRPPHTTRTLRALRRSLKPWVCLEWCFRRLLHLRKAVAAAADDDDDEEEEEEKEDADVVDDDEEEEDGDDDDEEEEEDEDGNYIRHRVFPCLCQETCIPGVMRPGIASCQ